MDTNLLAIVVVSFSTSQKTEQCLRLLLRYTDRPFHIYVVDNASTDESKSMLLNFQEHAKDFCSVYFLEHNVGYTRAIEAVLRNVPSDADLCFINPDVYVGPKWASRLTQMLYQASAIAAVAPIARGIGGAQDIVSYYQSICPIEYSENAVDLVNERLLEEPIRAATAKLLQGTMLLIKRDAWKDIGSFDPGCICAADDADWCLRARLKGYILIVALDTFVWHDNHSSFEKLDDGGSFWINESWAYFNKKWAGQFDHLTWDDLFVNAKTTTHPPYVYEKYGNDYGILP